MIDDPEKNVTITSGQNITLTESKSDKSDGTDTGDTNNLMLYFDIFDLVMLSIVAMLYKREKVRKK